MDNDNTTIRFELLIQFSEGYKWSDIHATIECSLGQILLNKRSCKVMYNGLQLRFIPTSRGEMFFSPVYAKSAICFDNTDPQNPKIEDVYQKIKPFLTEEIIHKND